MKITAVNKNKNVIWLISVNMKTTTKMQPAADEKGKRP